ncbi:polysaccharide pyruvyl transferase family protein [Curtobacterium sp. MCPF17_002]|uniref:polysaccharide pyruvyl transferase family protein n=1 Tax=Curtobacterium sp. MCPF17_002 TaxID=2175645 RepID=UPI000DAA49B3|nr:polysaccharide pyruvyl transferase family protein [Curtobacterium sp. MCPF17_002]WIB78034.1 polysaccharide pyruvyl transferase family protein [Curtobacterium sp. MCPF17_002]
MTRDRVTRDFVYLGWQGYDNFGDDLLHETWRAALDAPLDVEAPLHARAYVKRSPAIAAHRLRTLGSRRLVLLGGGTTVGFGTWAGHARRAGLAYGAEAVVGLGLGAAESTDTHLLSSQPHDWEAWRRSTRFRLAGVRGPLSQHEVSQHLGPTEVVGDPALLYPVVRPVTPSGAPAIGVTLGSDPTTRFDLAAVAAVVGRRAAQDRLPVRVFALSRADRAVARELAARITAPVEIHDYTGDVHATMRAIAACTVLVSERLHGAIAAVALGVPTVPLAYASKCDDFWMSVTGSRPTTTVGASEATISAAVDHVIDHAVDHAIDHSGADDGRTIARSVAAMQRSLGTLADRLSAWRSGAPLDLDRLTEPLVTTPETT